MAIAKVAKWPFCCFVHMIYIIFFEKCKAVYVEISILLTS